MVIAPISSLSLSIGTPSERRVAADVLRLDAPYVGVSSMHVGNVHDVPLP